MYYQKEYYKTEDNSRNFNPIEEIRSPSNLEMKFKTIKYANTADPEVWGPSFWFILHNGAAKYPEKASPLYAERMKGFILGIPVMIPCEKCSDHATAHIESNWHNLDKIVSSRKELFSFFHSFHNYVNTRYGKPNMTLEDAYALYSGRANVTKLSYGNMCNHR